MREVDRLVGNQIHRRAQEEMRADRRESHNHEMPLADGFAQLMAVVKAYDPHAVAVCPMRGVGSIQPPMRRPEIQKQRHLDRRQMALTDWCGKEARAREIAMDIGFEARIGAPLKGLPPSEF